MKIDERLLAYKPISVTLNFDWDNTTYDERVLARHNYIEEQKKKDPNYIGWDFPEHFNCNFSGVCKDPIYITDFTKLVNTLGQIIRITDGVPDISFGWDRRGYRTMSLKGNNVRREFTIHRIVACTFIPIPKHLKEIRELIVINHKNDVKNCNLRSNLEWCTNQENITKAVETGAKSSKSFKFTMTRPGTYFGKSYYFPNMTSIVEHGFNYASVYVSANKNRRYLCGTWEIISKEELDGKSIGMSKEVIDFIKNPVYGRNSVLGQVGTIVTEGPCKGEQFVLYGSEELKKYGFNPDGVYGCVLGRRNSHKGCSWIRVPIEETINIQIGLTEKQKKHIFE